MTKPISLAAARKRERSGQGGGAPADPDNEEDPCPITALGHADGKMWFLNIEGERRCLSARQLGMRSEIAMLLLGDMRWVQAKFPKLGEDGRPAGFNVARAAEFLMTLCRRQGIYGDHVVVRRGGVWPGEHGAPVAHCGDAVFVDGEKRVPGCKIAGQIFAAGPREVYPAAIPATAEVGRQYQQRICELWTCRDVAAEMIVLGLVGAGYLAGALSWRPNGFLSGASNAGKSNLLELMRALTPLSHYTTDTSKAGIEGAVNGRAVPSFIDEAADRVDQRGAEMLMDIVLSASSGAGTKGHRGTADGGTRTIEMVGSVVMASVSPPAMQAQHRNRFVLIELLKPEAGADHRAEMTGLIATARDDGPALFARALQSFGRYKAALAIFRSALGAGGSVAREMDLLGSILAGWHILTNDGLPTAENAALAVRDIGAFIRSAAETAAEDAPQKVLAILLSRLVSLDRSTEHDSLGGLIRKALTSDMEASVNRDLARRVLELWGLRPVRDTDIYERRDRLFPREGEGNGVWIDPRVEGLRGVFNGTVYAGDRWKLELLRLPKARYSRRNVRVSALPPGKAIWISWDDLDPDGLADDG